MSYELWIGARYAGLARSRRRAGGGDRFVSFIAASSMAGIALGVAALIIVLSVMNGFQTQVRDRMLSVLPHIELFVPSASPLQVLEQWRSIADEAAAASPAITGEAPFVSAQAMVARGESFNGAQIRGVDPVAEDAVSELRAQMIDGSLDQLKAGAFNIVLGNQLARALGVRVGDTVMVLAPQGAISPAGF